ncbi:hypothetical protein XFPR_02015 [Xylella fastidiosa]|nr:hypothetical protein [Xylella fastidiosa]ALQ94088.1 hypothetical protein XFUD_01775 [Xylella fastidiosa]ALQ96329.1 hypothetical protein XFC3_01775 [Xylella fastidiosa]ALR01176.1 hypothetical protein OY18_01760 [Xylella fastidiosa]ALR03600.1 hypothetical protein XFPR_02015 [Xylella fastidiosa]ALR05787.1 hypothetical protein XFHB_01735 [Xylella fastidiosa]
MSLRAVRFQRGVLRHRWCCWLRFHWREGDAAARAMGGIGDLYCQSVPMTCTDAVGVNAPSLIPALIAAVAVMFSGACP